MTASARICVVGATGRMGSRVVRLIHEFPNLGLASVLERRSEGADIGELLGLGRLGVAVTTDPTTALSASDLVIDFSAPPACAALAPRCADEGISYLCASTGLSEAEQACLDSAAERIAVLQAANLSIGVNVLQQLVGQAAARLGDAFDVEIFEIHHHHKRDAPSGTAYALGESVKQVRTALVEVPARAGDDAVRGPDSLGYAAVRGGDVAGEHTVFFFGQGERLELTHRSTTPDIFARGALRAAEWLAGRGPGRYSMADVLELD